jgi:vancomycin resistance protein YoaR
MDPHNERWPHVDIVRDELRRLQAEQTAAAVKARAAHFAELKQHMTGYDKTRTRIERRTSVRTFTERMLKYGEKVLNEQRKNGCPVTDR